MPLDWTIFAHCAIFCSTVRFLAERLPTVSVGVTNGLGSLQKLFGNISTIARVKRAGKQNCSLGLDGTCVRSLGRRMTSGGNDRTANASLLARCRVASRSR